tara:strand:- start:21439 stop:22032 length:594 start_codon:yes stop_codon:yes gene_type:complete
MSFSNINKYQIILASDSPRRKDLLKKSNISFRTISPQVEESFPSNLEGSEISDYLAKLKADSFKSTLNINEIVITADTIVWFKNQYIGKPKSIDETIQILKKMSNNFHTVITSVVITGLNKQIIFNEKSFVYFRELEDSEIYNYVKNFDTLDKAGGYGIQDWIGFVGVDKIEGSYTNIMGFPLSKFIKKMNEFLKTS